jgi:hypothetical protein
LFFVVVIVVRLSLRENTKYFRGNPVPLVVAFAVAVVFPAVTANPLGCGSLWKNKAVFLFAV